MLTKCAACSASLGEKKNNYNHLTAEKLFWVLFPSVGGSSLWSKESIASEPMIRYVRQGCSLPHWK